MAAWRPHCLVDERVVVEQHEVLLRHGGARSVATVARGRAIDIVLATWRSDSARRERRAKQRRARE